MKTTREKLLEFIQGSDILYLNDEFAEKMSIGIEINKPSQDLMVLIDKKPAKIINAQDELLFVLFFMFIDGYEYNHTLGCATYMHFTRNCLYESLCVKVSKLIKLVCCDDAKSNIPLDLGINFNTNSEFDTHMNEDSSFYIIICLFDKFADNMQEINQLICFIENIDTKKYDRIADLTNYDIGNFLHIDSGFRKTIVHFNTTKKIIENLLKNLLFVHKFMKAKNKFNFIIRNAKQIQNLPYFYRGLIAKNIDKKCTILLSEIGVMISKPNLLFFDNYFRTFFAIKYYYKILVLKNLVYKNKMFFADDYLLFYLQSSKNQKFREKEIKKIQEKVSNVDDTEFKMYNSGKVLCFDIFFNFSHKF